MYCEDFPCCGHTPQDPCERQWYDEPDAFDTTKNPHALCDHENGECDVDWDDEPDDDEDDSPVDQEYKDGWAGTYAETRCDG